MLSALSDLIDTAKPNDLGCSNGTAVCAKRRTDPAGLTGGVNVMAVAVATRAHAHAAKPWYKVLYLQVLIAILLGVVVVKML